MAAKKSLAPPPVLNDRQRQYLLAAYTLDQQLEAEHKHDYHRGISTSAREWRGMPYGRWQHFLTKPPTRLRELIEKEQTAKTQRLVDPGTGSTWKALAARGLVEVEERVIVAGPAGYPLPHIVLTREGRKLVRQLTGEGRPKAAPRLPKPPQPEGLLPEQQWSALARLYEVDYEGLPADDSRCLSFSRISYTVLWVLRERGLAIGSPDEQLHADNYTITAQGRAFYYQYYRTNGVAHHREYELPRPVLTAKYRAFWQRLEELQHEKSKALSGLAKRPPEAVRSEIFTLQIAEPVHTLYVEPYWYLALAGRGIELAPNIGLSDSHFDTEEEALAAGQHKVEKWKQQLSWLEPTA